VKWRGRSFTRCEKDTRDTRLDFVRINREVLRFRCLLKIASSKHRSARGVLLLLCLLTVFPMMGSTLRRPIATTTTGYRFCNYRPSTLYFTTQNLHPTKERVNRTKRNLSKEQSRAIQEKKKITKKKKKKGEVAPPSRPASDAVHNRLPTYSSKPSS
jgi:hypothetical protein